MKYKNKQGISLTMTGKDPATALTREVIQEAIKKDWAIQRCKDFLQENFNLRRKND
jgi:hypothetical protein